jgi:hypothetical protein
MASEGQGVPSQLSAKFRTERSWNGHRPDVLKSGLQKYIRRGEVDKALFCAGELDLFKHAPEDRREAIRTNFIHRLMITYLEDVGIGDLGSWREFDGLSRELLTTRKSVVTRNMRREEQIIAAMVHRMCIAQKARSCSHVRAISSMDAASRALLSEKFPELAALAEQVDSEQRASGRVGEGLQGFWVERLRHALAAKSWTAVWWARKIYEREDTPAAKKAAAELIFKVLSGALQPALARLVPCGERWHSELKTLKEAFLSWMVLIVAHNVDAPVTTHAEPLSAQIARETGWQRNRSGWPDIFEGDDFVFDRHTAKGRSHTITEFALVGAHVENESPLVVPLHKQFYVDQKKASSVYVRVNVCMCECTHVCTHLHMCVCVAPKRTTASCRSASRIPHPA